MQNRYTAPAASSGEPPRASGIIASMRAMNSGWMPTGRRRPPTSMVVGSSASLAIGCVMRVLMKPKATQLTVTL